MKLLVLFAVCSVAHSQSLPEVLTREGATTLVDFVVKAGLAELLHREPDAAKTEDERKEEELNNS